MARSGKFTQGVLLATFGQGLMMLVGLWLTPFVLTRIGQSQYGLWIAGQQCLVYLTLMDFGIVALLPRETAYAVGRAGSAAAAHDIPALLARTARLVVLQTPLIALASATLWWRLPASWNAVRNPIGVAVVAFTLLFPFRIFRAALDGLQDLGFTGWSYLSSWFAGVAITVSLVWFGFGLVALPAGWSVTQSVDAIICYSRLRTRFPFAVPRRWFARDGLPLFSSLGRGSWVSVSQLAQVLTYGTDALVVGRMFGAAAIVPYSCTGKLISVLTNQPLSLMRAAEPGLSEMRTREHRDRLAPVTSALTLAVLLLSGLVATVTLAVNAGFVKWWVGTARYEGLRLTLLFAVAMTLRHWNVTMIYTLFAFGHERWIAATNLTDGVLSTALSIGLAWTMHSVMGVVLGSIVSTSCILLFGNGPVLCRELGISGVALLRPLLPWFWRILLAAGGATAFSRWLSPSTLVGLALTTVAAAAGYAALMFPVVMRSRLRLYLAPTLEILKRFPFWRKEAVSHAH